MGRELGRFLESRRRELGLSRRDVAERSDLSYPYVSQLETGDREPALKAMRALAPVLEIRVEDLAALVAGGEWSADSTPPATLMAPMSAAAMPSRGGTGSPVNRDKVLLSLERRLRDVPPLERISLLNEMISDTVEELSGPAGSEDQARRRPRDRE